MAKVDAAVDGEVSLSSSAPPNHGMNTMTQGPVEARSLSSITAVASNPPSYPRNPAQKKLDPLELYIVRVPGSKGEEKIPLRLSPPRDWREEHLGFQECWKEGCLANVVV